MFSLDPARLLGLLVVTASACATTTAPSARVALLPLDVFGLAPARAVTAVERLSRQLAALGTVRLVSRRAAAAAMQDAACKTTRTTTDAQIACASEVGKRLGATHAVIGALGGLGNTYVLRLKVVEVGQRAVSRAVEETVFDTGQERSRQTMAAVARRLFDSGPPPWYQRWWVWAAVGAAAAAAVVIPVATRDSDPYREIQLP